MRGNSFPGTASGTAPKQYGTQHTDVVRTARKWQFCRGGSWHQSCGRVIEAGERYLSLYRGGLSQFHICSGCASLDAEA